MIRSIFITLLVLIASVSTLSLVQAAEDDPYDINQDLCQYSTDKTLTQNLNGCRPDRVIAAEGDNYQLQQGAREKVLDITGKIIQFAAILSILGIVISGILYIISFGDTEKGNKAKNALTYAIIGFVVALVSAPVVNAIVNLLFRV